LPEGDDPAGIFVVPITRIVDVFLDEGFCFCTDGIGKENKR
jgi:hypothetical protein